MAQTYRYTLARRLLNGFMALLVRLGLGPRTIHLLTTVGRRSGVRRTQPVNVLEFEGQRWLVSPYGLRPWVLNARANGQAWLRRGRALQRVRLEEVEQRPRLPCSRPTSPSTASRALTSTPHTTRRPPSSRPRRRATRSSACSRGSAPA